MSSRTESLEFLVQILARALDPEVLDSILLNAVRCVRADDCPALVCVDEGDELVEGAWRGERDSREAGTRSRSAWVRRIRPGLALVLSTAPEREERRSIEALLDVWERRAPARTDPEEDVPAALPASAADLGLRELAHDLRNHVAALLTNLEVLRKEDACLDEGERLHFRAVVERECRRVGALLVSALDLRDERAAESTRAGLVSVLRDTLDSERPAFDAAAIELETRIESGAAETRYPISEIEFGRLIRNLLVNAREACSEANTRNARVRLECSLGDEESGGLLLAVVDGGPGIAASVLSRLFEVGVSTHTGERGLGLASVREITERSGGSVRSRNRSGGGAVFEVHIPASAQVGSRRAGASGPGSAHQVDR